LWSRCRNSRSINAPIAGVLFAIEFLLVDVIAAFTPIMIAAATGAGL
jgi:CIC family chloride channel protein